MMRTRAAIHAPAGSFESLHAALDAGADAVYFGAGPWNMRAGGAVNFRPSELKEVVKLCHGRGAKAVLAVNTIVYEGELAEVRRLCEDAKRAEIDACIAGDPAVLMMLRELGIPAHITVQCNVSNLESVRFYAPFADVIVPARELPLGSIRSMAEGIRRENIRGPSGKPVALELFAHGALCIGISGRCGMSLCTSGRSANRGECLQPCRRRYLVRDAETGEEMEIDNSFVMSPRDLCTVGFLDRILDSGVSVLKIEGRGRPADYVYTAVSVYREAADACLNGTFGPELVSGWMRRLKSVFNRGFWEGGYYLGNTLSAWSGHGGSLATYAKVTVGRVTDWYARAGAVAVRLESGGVRLGDRIRIVGPATGFRETVLEELRVDDVPANHAEKGSVVSFPMKERVRPGDLVQVARERMAEDKHESQ